MSFSLPSVCVRTNQPGAVPRGLGKDWTDYFQAGSTPEDFETLLDRAPSLGLRLPELTCR